MAAIYSCWPVYVIPLNLPPGFCMQRHQMFLTLIIPGPNYPGKHMSVYMEPLVDDLLVAWNNGVRTYDVISKKHFNMHIWYHTSLHDLLARAIFCGWCVKGKWPCPVCRQRVTFIWLAKVTSMYALTNIGSSFVLITHTGKTLCTSKKVLLLMTRHHLL